MTDTASFTPIPTLTPCEECGAALADDQRYCLNCGRRRPEARLPFRDVLGPGSASAEAGSGAGPVVAAASSGPQGGSGLSANPATVLAGLALAVVVLGVGVLVGQASRGSSSKAPVVNVNGGGGGGVASASTAVPSDWPTGKTGWTIQLQTLPKATTQPAQVAAAKTAAQDKGVPTVGALDSDVYKSLSPGQYVVYSGVYDTQPQAQGQLAKVKASYPTALVVQVSTIPLSAGAGGRGAPIKGNVNLNGPRTATGTLGTQQLQQLSQAQPAQREKQSLKLPDVTSNGGTPPPKDNKKPSGPTSVIG